MAHKDQCYDLDKSLDLQIDLAKFSDACSLSNKNNQNQQDGFHLIEESYPISYNYKQSQQDSEAELNAAFPQNNSITSINLTESFPLQINITPQNGMDKLRDQYLDQKFELKKSTSFQLQESTPIQIQKEQKQNQLLEKQDILVSYPIQINRQNTIDNNLDQVLKKKQLYESISSNQPNIPQSNDSNTQRINMQRQQQQKQLSYYADQNMQNERPNQQLYNSTGGIQNAQRGQKLAGTQIINEIQKCESSEGSDEEEISTPFQSFDPDILSNTNQKKNKQYVQHFDLKLLDQINKPAKILQSDGKQKVIIGRIAPNKPKPPDIQIDCDTVSGKHAQICWKPQQITWCLSDEGSTNGTYLIINNAPIKENDEIMIGLHLVKIVKITKDFPIQVELLFENTVEDVPQFTCIAKIDLGSKFMIGKSHQKGLESDFLIKEDHCYIFFENRKLKIQNCENVQYKTAKKLDSTKQVDLPANSVIRFGFFNQYLFTPYTKVVETTIETQGLQKKPSKQEKKCRSCNKEYQQLYALIPCKHDQFCKICSSVITSCPICEMKVTDFS